MKLHVPIMKMDLFHISPSVSPTGKSEIMVKCDTHLVLHSIVSQIAQTSVLSQIFSIFFQNFSNFMSTTQMAITAWAEHSFDALKTEKRQKMRLTEEIYLRGLNKNVYFTDLPFILCLIWWHYKLANLKDERVTGRKVLDKRVRNNSHKNIRTCHNPSLLPAQTFAEQQLTLAQFSQSRQSIPNRQVVVV